MSVLCNCDDGNVNTILAITAAWIGLFFILRPGRIQVFGILPQWLRPLYRKWQANGYYLGSLHSAVVFASGYTIINLYWKDVYRWIRPGALKIGNEENGDNDNLAVALGKGFLIWTFLAFLRKWFLRRLLRYHGWLYETKNPSLKTKIFGIVLRLLNGWRTPLTNQLYGLQNILPSLPLPRLTDTVNQYLQSMKPLLNEDQMEKLQQEAREFVGGHGPKLQRRLIIKSWLHTNYVNDWWLTYGYLADRSSLLLGTSGYTVDCLNAHTKNQAARAALVCYKATEWLLQARDNKLQPISIKNKIPLCNVQCERAYGTTRIPHEDVDTLQHVMSSDHLVVFSKGKYWKFNVFWENSKELLSPAEFQLQFQRILEDTSEPLEGEARLAALTTLNRPSWARARNKYFGSGINQESLEWIDKALFMVGLDDEDYSMEHSDEQSGVLDDAPIDYFAKKTWCGDGGNRWLDKSFSCMFSRNGSSCASSEHSWSDGSIVGHIVESTVSYSCDFSELDEDGRVSSCIQENPPPPQRLPWDFTEDCIACIDRAFDLANQSISTIDLKLFAFNHFGKREITKCGLSSDAFVQMALQLAYYRNQGQFDLTYEPATTRLFLHGRTETIRSCTEESCRWVLNMENPNVERSARISSFLEACSVHQKNGRRAMTGGGCDRHLFALYVMSKHLELDVPFLKDALARPWKLSTSQLPCSQIQHPKLEWPGAGFAPVCPDGYGVSYVLMDHRLFFHVSSKNTCDKTSSKVFSQQILRALFDAWNLISPEKSGV